MVSPQGRREQCAYACGRGIPKRRACGLIGMARSTLSYALRQPEKDALVMATMQRLSSQYPRYGYRRIRIFLRREGLAMSASRAERLWRKAGLQLPRKRPRRRIAASRPRPLPPRAAHHVWAYDFVFDACANGQQIKCLTVVDEFTHECLAIDVAGSIRSRRVIAVLARLISLHGAPVYLRSDSGPEFVSHAILKWLTENRITPRSSIPENLGRTEPTNRSTANCATSVSVWSGSAAAVKPAFSSRHGVGTTTPYARTRA